MVASRTARIGNEGPVEKLTYDAFNRLRLFEFDSVNLATYAYDAGNRRVRKTVENGGVSGTVANGSTHYYYSGWRVIEERALSANPGTRAEAVAKPTAQYAWGGRYLDELWAFDRPTGTLADLNDGASDERLFALHDTLYSVVGLTDEAGALVEAFEYDPYGTPTRLPDGPDANGVVDFTSDDVRTAGVGSAYGLDMSFTGQRLDPETGLNHFKSRYLESRLGVFTTRDPMGWFVDPNQYSFALNNSYKFVDTYGLAADIPDLELPPLPPDPPNCYLRCRASVLANYGPRSDSLHDGISGENGYAALRELARLDCGNECASEKLKKDLEIGKDLIKGYIGGKIVKKTINISGEKLGCPTKSIEEVYETTGDSSDLLSALGNALANRSEYDRCVNDCLHNKGYGPTATEMFSMRIEDLRRQMVAQYNNCIRFSCR